MKVGDRVTWMETKSRGSGMSFSSKEGVVKELHPSGATVRRGNGRTTFIYFADLRLTSEKNHVTEVFEAIAGSKVGARAVRQCPFCAINSESNGCQMQPPIVEVLLTEFKTISVCVMHSTGLRRPAGKAVAA